MDILSGLISSSFALVYPYLISKEKFIFPQRFPWTLTSLPKPILTPCLLKRPFPVTSIPYNPPYPPLDSSEIASSYADALAKADLAFARSVNKILVKLDNNNFKTACSWAWCRQEAYCLTSEGEKGHFSDPRIKI